MKHVEFIVIFDDGVRKRHSHRRKKGIVHAFVVQLEAKVEDVWLPVVRYDSAHGISHIDRYTPDGKKRKIVLDLDFNTALTLADWDIDNNWENYIKDFLRGKK